MNTKTQTIDQSKLDALHLTRGTHGDPEGGLCLMEAVAFFAGERHSDHPECVSPELGAWGREVNDAMPTDRRQELKAFIPEMVGTAGDGRDEVRAFMCDDFAVRVMAPMALDATKLREQAEWLRELPEIVDKKTAADAYCADAYRAAAAYPAAYAAAAAYRADDDASPIWDAVIAFTPKLIAARADNRGGQR